MHVLGQKLILISLGLSQKREIEKWLLRTSVQCIFIKFRSELYRQIVGILIGTNSAVGTFHVLFRSNQVLLRLHVNLDLECTLACMYTETGKINET